MENKDFVHLHLHNEYSVLDGMGTAKQYCDRAKEIGFTSLALTNHGNVDGCIKFQRACKEAEIKPIFGCEAYIVPDLAVKEPKENRAHITLLAQNSAGWSNILKMLTVANIEGFYSRPRIDPDLLLDHCEGVAIGSACLASYLRWPRWKGWDLARRLQDKGCLVYLELMPIDIEEQRTWNKELCKFYEKYGFPLVATNDCHYVLSRHSKVQEVLLAMQTKKKWSDPKRWKFDINTLYLQSTEEMEDHFRKYSGVSEDYWRLAMESTKLIADTCNFEIEKKNVFLPKVYVEKYKQLDADSQLVALTMDGWEERKRKHDWITPEREAEYLERMEYELGIICGLSFADYFLIVWELINWCRQEDLKGPWTDIVGPIMVGPGRGSSGGSLVAFCLGITQVDPLKYDLVFSRFISEARIDLPDIDMDFEDRRREDVIQHLKDLYGEYNVIGVSNFMKMKGKAALRGVARVFDVPAAEVKSASKAIITRSGGDMRSDFSLKDSFETIEDGKKFFKKYPEVCEIAMELEGLIMGHGRHAAAAVVSRYDLRAGVNCAYANRKDHYCCNWEKNDAEYNGLMKLDVLGLNALTILNEARVLIKQRHNIDIVYETLPLDDKRVLEEFNKGRCVGVFQFNGNSIMRFCRDIGVQTFDDVVALNALHRPGTLKSGTIHNYKDRKHGREPIPHQHPYLQAITAPTYGIMIYQEQIMRIAFECAGLGWKTADTIRKAVSKSQGEAQLLKFKDAFVEGCERMNTLTKKEAEDIFEIIKVFGSYSFNKSHSVEYSMIAYWEMYLKIHYPTEYFVSYLTWGSSDDKKDDMIQEARNQGLKILVPDINLSDSKRWIGDSDGNILIPFEEIIGVGPVASVAIVKEREENGLYRDFSDFEFRVKKLKVNSKVRGLLKECYCFEEDKAACDLDNDEIKLDKLSKNFYFNLSNDPMYKYRGPLQLLRKHIDIKPISKVFGGGDFVWGLVDKITYQIKTASKESIGYSGCYGQLKDEEKNYIMMNFTRELTAAKKDELEHSEGLWVIGQVATRKDDAITVSKLWYGDDLLRGEVSLPGFRGLCESISVSNTIMDQPILLASNLKSCVTCELRKECSRPVYPSAGRYNAMIIGEAPGRNEDSRGIGFAGAAGDIIWYGDKARDCIGFSEYGLSRDDFWVSNFVKCWPSETKTPKPKHLTACKPWIDREIRTVKPFVILAFGNTALWALKKEKSGIMEASGKVEWNEEYGCWVVYCLHPAAVLYHSENSVYYNSGMMSFLNVFLNMGFGN